MKKRENAEEEKYFRILLGYQYALIRTGLEKLLNENPKFTIISHAEDGNELIRKHEQSMPDLIITDPSLPKKRGISAVKEIRKSDREVRIIFVSEDTTEKMIYTCFKAGGQGLISKNGDVEDLFHAIEEVMNGEEYFLGKTYNHFYEATNRFQKPIIQSPKGESKILTRREEEILLLVAKDYSTSEIAALLKISPRTVDTHRHKIIKKFHLNSLAGLLNFAAEYSALHRKD